MRIVGIVRSNSVQNEIQAIGKVGDARSQSIQVKPVLNVRSLDLAKHFVPLQSTEPIPETNQKKRMQQFCKIQDDGSNIEDGRNE